MSDNGSHITDALESDVIAQLEGVLVRVAPDRETDLRTLLGAWERHVEKIERDLDLPDTDRSVWGAHDLLAALSLRSFVERGLGDLSDDLPEGARIALIAIDERFRSYTEADVAGSIRTIDGRPEVPEHWWWHRIPRRGPVRRDVDQIARNVKLGK